MSKKSPKSVKSTAPRLNIVSSQNTVLDEVNKTRRVQKEKMMEQMLSIYLDNPRTGATDVSRTLGVARNTVYNYLEELEEAKRIRRNGDGVIVLEDSR